MVQLDIPMPKTCYECPCHDGENNSCQVTGKYYYGEILRSCPLIELPSTQPEQRWIPFKTRPLTKEEKAVFHCIANCELSTYTTTYPPERVVISTGDIAKMCLWSKYRTRKAINGLVEKGLIERASCGCPAVVSYGECPELICEAKPPMNGYAISKQGFKSEEWKDIYDMWCRSMEEWANMPLAESEE